MALLIYILNAKTMYVGDDYTYRFFYITSYPQNHLKVINTFLIPSSMWNHYMNWNGRFVAHSIVQYFMQFNTKIIFNICNSVVYVFLIMLINKLASQFMNHKSNIYLIIGIFFFLWFNIPDFGETVLWASGSGNYLWTSVIYLSFIYLNTQEMKPKGLIIFLMSLVGFLAGATNENSGPAAILIVILLMIVRYTKVHKIQLVSLSSVIFAIIGFIVMMHSPGSQKRGQMHRTVEKILSNFDFIYKLDWIKFHYAYWTLLIILVVLLILKKLDKQMLTYFLVFMIGHFCAVYSMAFSPDIPERTFFGGLIFLAVATFILAYRLIDYVKRPNIILIVLSLFFISSYWNAYKDISFTYNEICDQYAQIIKQKVDGKKTIKVKLLSQPKTMYNAYNGTVYIVSNPVLSFNKLILEHSRMFYFFDLNKHNIPAKQIIIK